MRLLITIFFFIILAFNVQAENDDKLIGIWQEENTGMQVEITKCDNFYCGTIIEIEDQTKDKNNRIPEFRNRLLDGLQIISNLSKLNETNWSGGLYYSISQGIEGSLSCKLIDNNTLLLTIATAKSENARVWKRK